MNTLRDRRAGGEDHTPSRVAKPERAAAASGPPSEFDWGSWFVIAFTVTLAAFLFVLCALDAMGWRP